MNSGARRFLASFILVWIVAFPHAAHAQGGDLVVAPVRVVFEGRARVAEVTLVSRADEVKTYRISFENRRMTPTGSFVAIDNAGPGERFSDSLVRYAPRSVELEPGKAQTIRLLLRKPADLESGEYRSHLKFAAVPETAGAINSIERTGDKKDGISIALTPIYGVTIPVIVRHGQTKASTSIASADLVDDEGGIGVVVDLQREGTRSVYGDIRVYSANGRTLLTEQRGIAVYTPNNNRQLRLGLTADAANTAARDGVLVKFDERSPRDNASSRFISDPLK
ncbi:molecular chaperone [Parvularcula sp. ZS-1/3]|uniref:Molecular chaperone n=1 Tax=Parvularcula mediterranea TaxID=2732508 RepID=A0A7Y3W4Q0_9PROT|nr:molecular chaperone [Parvularcula mediterranea]NNU15487.1 molecular chaperone [Parvularcula mediterranea]